MVADFVCAKPAPLLKSTPADSNTVENLEKGLPKYILSSTISYAANWFRHAYIVLVKTRFFEKSSGQALFNEPITDHETDFGRIDLYPSITVYLKSGVEQPGSSLGS